jgi:DNA-binding NarL/FixJ family response regulator
MYDNQTLITTALQLGAKGFVSKSSDPLNIIKAIQSVIKGRNYLSDDLVFTNNTNDIPSEIQKIQLLTTKELEIFKMLAEGKSITACADILNISDKTANNYQTSLRNKLGVVNSAELVHMALRHGIIKSYL